MIFFSHSSASLVEMVFTCLVKGVYLGAGTNVRVCVRTSRRYPRTRIADMHKAVLLAHSSVLIHAEGLKSFPQLLVDINI
jgi:hypothetical protein